MLNWKRHEFLCSSDHYPITITFHTRRANYQVTKKKWLFHKAEWGFKPQHGQIIARVVAGSSPRAVISSGDTKSIAVSFTQTATKTTINSSGKPATTPATTQATSPDKTNQAFPVNIKHQVVGKFVTAQGNQQILVQNQAGLLKNSKNQPLVAKFVTQGSHNAAHMIKVLSNPQGQPFIGKISTGGINSKPIVAKITNAQGQPIYSMEDLFSQSNKGAAACFRIASSPNTSKPQKIVASINSPTQSIAPDQQQHKPQNILIKPQQPPQLLSPQPGLNQISVSQQTQMMTGKPVQSLTNQQLTAITSQAQLQQALSPSYDKSKDDTARSQQQNMFTTQYVQTIPNQPAVSSQQKIQVALSQADNTQQFQQYLQTNQILTQVVSSSDQLQNIAAKPPANVQQKNVINISQLVTNMNTTGAKDETFEGDQLKNATVVHQGTQYVTTSVAGIHRLVQQPNNKFITTTSTAPQLVRMVPAGSLKNLGSNPFILTSGKGQQTTMTDPSQLTSQGTVLLAPQAIQTTNGRTLTLVQQGNGQPLLLPSNFQGGTLNIKTLQGMKVIPFSQNGRQQVLARIIPPNVKSAQQPVASAPQKPNVKTDGDPSPT
ncbi:hypothetical protein M8J76_016857 [Diaphorina citri]|nr:hypothetical protein M8J76_016857 [Diaphorina citri]